MITFSLITFGCKVNQYDSQRIREGLREQGGREVSPRRTRPDLCIVNTCAVTRAAQAKSRRAVTRIARECPGSKIVVTGCCVEHSPREFALLPGVTGLVRNDERDCILEYAGGPGTLPRTITGFSDHSRAFLKIQEGCDAACSYCVIPRLRGCSRSRPMDEVVDEARVLSAHGYRELVLAGIHLGAYGNDFPGRDELATLVTRLAEDLPGVRVRLSSIEPMELSDRLIAHAARGTTLCPHFHVSLQSGNDRILAAMKRAYTAQAYRERIDRIRKRVPGVSLTTDVMIGFPGEDDDAFQATVEMVAYCGFNRVHIFPYSPRAGTPAWGMGDPVPHHEKERRMRILREVVSECASRYRARFLGNTVEALVLNGRTGDNGIRRGLTREYQEILFPGSGVERGRLCDVTVNEVTATGLRGVRHGHGG